MRKLLYSRQSECLQPLRELVEKQLHRTLVVWALECAQPYLAFFEAARPEEGRPRQALETAGRWARGQAKMPEAKKAIHAAHSAAAAVGDATPQAAALMAAGRALGHAAATVHVETHALELAFYGLTSKHYAAGECDEAVEAELARLYARLLYWQAHIARHKGPWAAFLQGDTRPNKELLLRLAQEAQPNRKEPAGNGG